MKNGICYDTVAIHKDGYEMHTTCVTYNKGVVVAAFSNSFDGIRMEPGHTHFRHDYHYFWSDISHFVDGDGNRVEKASDAGMNICTGLVDGEYQYKTL